MTNALFRSGSDPTGTTYCDGGTGEPVMLVHGVGLDQSVWHAQHAFLARRFRVVTYDTLGHGGSALPPEHATIRHYSDQLARLMDHLHITSANLVGHSMGALVVLDFAMAYPAKTIRVAALNGVFMRAENAAAQVRERAQSLLAASGHQDIDGTIARWFGNPVSVEAQADAQIVRTALARINPVGYARAYGVFATSDRIALGELAASHTPVLFMTGEHDPNSTPAMSAAMAQAVRGSELDIVDGAGHMMTMTHSSRINLTLNDFLNRRPSDRMDLESPPHA